MTETKLIKLTIDDQEVEVPEGTLIVDAAKMIGNDIPVFCYHPKMEPVGMCRMCLVEIGRPVKDKQTGEWVREEDGSLKIQFGPKLETACTTPISEGMVVRGNSKKALAGRKDILEFLLTSHPLDCPICDKGGECPLQDLTMAFGPGQSRFLVDEKYSLKKHVPLGELIILDRERCIQCARCIRFQDEVVDDPVIGFYQRGRGLEIVTFSEPGFDSYFSGNTTDICPVGALTTIDFRFEARPWELMAGASICPHCPVGCNTTLNTRREARAQGDIVIKRVMPRQNEKVNEIWICDKGRFAYHFAQAGDRLVQPMVRRNGELIATTWVDALNTAVEGIRAGLSGSEAGKDFLAVGSGRLSNEDLYNLQKFSAGLGGKTALYTGMGGGDLVAKVGAGMGTNFAEMGAEATILVVACDLQEEAPIWFLQVKQAVDRGAKLIVVNPRETRLEKYASQVIRYPYGAEAQTILGLLPAQSTGGLSAKRPDSGEDALSEGRNGQMSEAARAVTQAENLVIIYGSEGTGLESSQALAQACANLLIATGHTGKRNNGLIAAWTDGNQQGAWDMGFRPVPDLKSAFAAAGAVLIAGADPAGDSPELAEGLRSAGFVVVQELFLTETANLADVVFPALSFAEREGTYTNGLRRVQRFYPAISKRPNCLPDFTITAQLGEKLGLDLEGRFAILVMERIAVDVPDYQGITYQKLAEVEEQWPIVGRGDMYYGGTTYDNHQGMGAQLTTAAGRGEPMSPGWIQPEPAPAPEGGLLGVPITRLYDRGETVIRSRLLETRIPKPYVALNPDDAGQMGIKEGQAVLLETGQGSIELTASVDERVPVGIALLPRGMGIPVHAPAIVTLRMAQAVGSGSAPNYREG